MSTILNPKQRCYSIVHESVNFSTSKQKYSFGRERRFPSVSRPTPSEFNTELGSTFGKRSPSFGYGDRFKTLNINGRGKLYIHKSFFFLQSCN